MFITPRPRDGRLDLIQHRPYLRPIVHQMLQVHLVKVGDADGSRPPNGVVMLQNLPRRNPLGPFHGINLGHLCLCNSITTLPSSSSRCRPVKEHEIHATNSKLNKCLLKPEVF
ncbi:hypothetical protein ACHAXT_006272 [Thalassiosira profunda]